MSSPNDPANPGPPPPDPAQPGPPTYGPPPAYGQPPHPPGYGQPPAYGPPPAYGQPPGYGYPPAPGQPGSPFAPSAFGSGDPAWGGVAAADEDPLISRDYAGWWRRGTAVAKAAWRQLAILQLVSLVVILAVSTPYAVVLFNVAGRFIDLARATPQGQQPDLSPLRGDLAAMVAFGLLATVAGGVTYGLTQLASYRLVLAAGSGGPISVGAALSGATKRFFPLAGWGILAFAMIGLGSVACVLPGLYFAAALYILPVIVAVERGTGIGRSFSLFHTSFGPALGRIATILGIGFTVSGVLTVVNQILVGGIISDFQRGDDPRSFFMSFFGVFIAIAALSALLQAALSLLTIPLTALIYADLRGRAEPGTTSATIRADLGLDPAPAPAPV